MLLGEQIAGPKFLMAAVPDCSSFFGRYIDMAAARKVSVNMCHQRLGL